MVRRGLLLLSLVACGDGETSARLDAATADSADAAPADARAAPDAMTGADAEVDAGAVPDAATSDSGLDAGLADLGPGSGADCAFNRDCPALERCACDEVTGCACETGPRGAGRLGVDPCASGHDCETALCLEGPGDQLVCSGPCEDATDCGGVLPLCADIAFVGRICIRDPNG